MSLIEDSDGCFCEPHIGFNWRFLCASWRIQLEVSVDEA